MIEIYPKQELDALTGQAIKEALQPFQFTHEGLLYVPAKNNIRAKKLIEMKELLEYKYAMPIMIQDGCLLFSAYSTYKFLMFALPYIKCSKEKMKYLTALIREHKRSHITLYAAGGIEKSPDHGVGYRMDLKATLKMTRAKIINPCDFKYNKQHGSLSEFGKVHTLDEYYEQCRMTVLGDVQAVLAADAVVLNVDPYMGSGSTSEITIATAVHKAVYGIVAKDYDIINMNPWAFGNITRFFNGMNAFREFLIEGE